MVPDQFDDGGQAEHLHSSRRRLRKINNDNDNDDKNHTTATNHISNN